MRLNGEFESRGGRIYPAFQQFFARKTTERVVHFDGVQARGVIAQELGGSQFRRIEIRLPSGIGPTRSTRIDLWHRTNTIVRERLRYSALLESTSQAGVQRGLKWNTRKTK